MKRNPPPRAHPVPGACPVRPMDALLVIGGANAWMWGWRSLLCPPTGFPLALLFFASAWCAGALPDRTYVLSDAHHPLLPLSEAALLLLAVDFVQLHAHRLMHTSPLRAHHAVHHRHVRPSASVAFDTGVVDAVVQLLLPVYACIWIVRPCRLGVGMYGLAHSAWLQFIHTSPDVPYPRLARLGMVTPAYHHAHHADPTRHMAHLVTWFEAPSKRRMA